MCFYAFSEDGEIDLTTFESIWIHPRYFKSPTGKSIISIITLITAKSRDIDSITILYPNILTNFHRLEINRVENIGFKISRSFSESRGAIEVLKHLSFEVLTLTFDKPIKKGRSVAVRFLLESPNASRIESDFREFTLNFTISGPDSVKRSFLQGLEGSEKWFKSVIDRSENAAEKEIYKKLLRSKKSIDENIVKPLNKNLVTIDKSNISLFIDPVLRGISIVPSNDLTETTLQGTPNIVWPFTGKLYKTLFGERRPHYYSFDYVGRKRKNHIYSIAGNAYRNVPTDLYLAILAVFVAFLIFFISR